MAQPSRIRLDRRIGRAQPAYARRDDRRAPDARAQRRGAGRFRLAREGWQTVACNVRVGDVRGEIDLIALDGVAPVFVEAASAEWARPAVPRPRRWRSAPESAPSSEGSRPRGCASAATTCHGIATSASDVTGLRVDGSGRVTEYEHSRGVLGGSAASNRSSSTLKTCTNGH